MRSWAWLALVVTLVACQTQPPPKDEAKAPHEPATATTAADASNTSAEPNDVASTHPSSEDAGTTRDVGDAPSKSEIDASASTAPSAPLVAPDGTVIAECGAVLPGMSCVPGGPFIRGIDDDPHKKCDQPSYNKRGAANTEPAQTIWLQTFYMDRTEVTFEAYKACAKTGTCEDTRPLYRDFSRPKQPMTNMSWYQAADYCKAQGTHLPTESQWEKAARGPDGALYPWGTEPVPSCELAVIMNAKGERSCGIRKIGDHPEKGRVLEVCSRPEGIYGLCDMAGNVEEWVADWYSQSWGSCGDECAGVDPKGPCEGGYKKCQGHRYKVIRGGSWYWPAEHTTGIHRRSHVPSNKPSHHFGFRCAASLEEAEAIAAQTAAAQEAEEDAHKEDASAPNAGADAPGAPTPSPGVDTPAANNNPTDTTPVHAAPGAGEESP